MSDFVETSTGSRGKRRSSRRAKTVEDYAAEHPYDLTCRSILWHGGPVSIIVCRFCCHSVGARSDRIKEHLVSKRHLRLKNEVISKLQASGRNLAPDDSSAMPRLPGVGLLRRGTIQPTETVVSGPNGGRQRTSQEANELALLIPAAAPPTPGTLNDFFRRGSLRQRSKSVSGRIVAGGFKQENKKIGGADNANRGIRRSEGNITSPPPLRRILPKRDAQGQLPRNSWRVRWRNFNSNMNSMFSALREKELFTDVSLWCEGKVIKCHKLVLATGSVYFEKLLTEMQVDHPVIFMQGMVFWQVEAIVDFMYSGEITVDHEKLKDLLLAAKSLQIKGLCASTMSPSEDARKMSKDNTGNQPGGNALSNRRNAIGFPVVRNSSTVNNNQGDFHPIIVRTTSVNEQPSDKFSTARGPQYDTGNNKGGNGCPPATRKRKVESSRPNNVQKKTSKMSTATRSSTSSDSRENNNADSEDTDAIMQQDSSAASQVQILPDAEQIQENGGDGSDVTEKGSDVDIASAQNEVLGEGYRDEANAIQLDDNDQQTVAFFRVYSSS